MTAILKRNVWHRRKPYPFINLLFLLVRGILKIYLSIIIMLNWINIFLFSFCSISFCYRQGALLMLPPCCRFFFPHWTRFLFLLKTLTSSSLVTTQKNISSTTSWVVIVHSFLSWLADWQYFWDPLIHLWPNLTMVWTEDCTRHSVVYNNTHIPYATP